MPAKTRGRKMAVVFGSFVCVIAFFELPASSLTLEPQTFIRGKEIPLFADTLQSASALFPMEVMAGLPIMSCLSNEKQQDVVKSGSRSLGEFLTGRQQYIAMPITMTQLVPGLQTMCCPRVCTADMGNPLYEKLIRNHYHVPVSMDNLDASLLRVHANGTVMTKTYSHLGIPLGYVHNGQSYVYNHWNIHVDYRAYGQELFQVVGLAIEPQSLAYNQSDQEAPEIGQVQECTNMDVEKLFSSSNPSPASGSVQYSYSIQWKPAQPPFPLSRWEPYFRSSSVSMSLDSPEAWQHLYWSVGFLVSLAILLMAKVACDYAESRQSCPSRDEKRTGKDEEIPTTYQHLFRLPLRQSCFLATLLGTGVSLFTTIGLIAGFHANSPEGRINDFVGFYVISGGAGGFVVGVMYKIFGGDPASLPIVQSSILGYPGLVFLFGLILSGAAAIFGSPMRLPPFACVYLGSILIACIGTGVFVGFHGRLPTSSDLLASVDEFTGENGKIKFLLIALFGALAYVVAANLEVVVFEFSVGGLISLAIVLILHVGVQTQADPLLQAVNRGGSNSPSPTFHYPSFLWVERCLKGISVFLHGLLIYGSTGVDLQRQSILILGGIASIFPAQGWLSIAASSCVIPYFCLAKLLDALFLEAREMEYIDPTITPMILMSVGVYFGTCALTSCLMAMSIVFWTKRFAWWIIFCLSSAPSLYILFLPEESTELSLSTALLYSWSSRLLGCIGIAVASGSLGVLFGFYFIRTVYRIAPPFEPAWFCNVQWITLEYGDDLPRTTNNHQPLSGPHASSQSFSMPASEDLLASGPLGQNFDLAPDKSS